MTGDLWGDGPSRGDCMVLIAYQWYMKECEGEQGVEKAFLAQKGVERI